MKKLKNILVLCLCLIVSVAVYAPIVQGKSKAKIKIRYYYTTKTAYLYSSNTKKKKRIKKIVINNKLSTNTRKTNKMYQVKFKGKKGYIYKSNLGTRLKTVKKYTNRNSYLYSTNKSNKKRLLIIHVDRRLSTKSVQSAKMFKVAYSGKTGYVYARNLGKSMVYYNNTYSASQITRYQVSQIPDQESYSQFKVPKFDSNKILNIPSAKKDNASTKPADLDVWDSWPLQNPDGTLAEYSGYHIVFAMAGIPKSGDGHIYMFYQKVGDNSLKGWKNAGRVFKNDDHLTANDEILKNQEQEWSGSAVLTNNGKIRLFYTDRHPWDPSNNFYGKQTLTTAQINLSQNNLDTLEIDSIEDLKSIFDGDGEYYQNVAQSIGVDNDDHCLRDPHYIEDNGHKYLVFEANTGTKTGYQETRALYNKAYYGGDDNYFNDELKKMLSNNGSKNRAVLANGALGIIELNDDYTLKKVMTPLITSNLVSDEIERPNVFKFHDKWYLFTATRGFRFTVDGVDSNKVYMLGYISDNLTGPYKPLNDTGLVLTSDEDYDSRTFTYSYFNILPSDLSSHNVVVTSYMTTQGVSETDHSTFAPSFLLTINGETTQVRSQDILEQGQLTTNIPALDTTKDSKISDITGNNNSRSYSK